MSDPTLGIRLVERTPTHELVTVEGAAFGVVTIIFLSRHGAIDDEIAGASYAALELGLRGAGDCTREELGRRLAAIGARMDVISLDWASGYSLQVLREQLGDALEILRAVLFAPHDDETELEHFTAEAEEDAELELEEPGEVVARAGRRALWTKEEWQRPVTGTRVSREQWSRRSLAAARSDVLEAPRIIGVASDDPHGDLERVMESLGSTSASRQRRTRVVPAARQSRLAWVRNDDAAQAYLTCTAPGPSADGPLWAASLVHAQWFGSSFVSPLVRRLRAELGLSYTVRWGLRRWLRTSRWAFTIEPENERIAEAWLAARDTWQSAATTIDEEGLEMARTVMISEFLESYQSTRSRLYGAMTMLSTGRDLWPLWTHPTSIRAVTLEDARSVGSRIDWSQMTSVVTCAEEPSDLLEHHARVEEIRLDELL